MHLATDVECPPDLRHHHLELDSEWRSEPLGAALIFHRLSASFRRRALKTRGPTPSSAFEDTYAARRNLFEDGDRFPAVNSVGRLKDVDCDVIGHNNLLFLRIDPVPIPKVHITTFIALVNIKIIKRRIICGVDSPGSGSARRGRTRQLRRRASRSGRGSPSPSASPWLPFRRMASSRRA